VETQHLSVVCWVLLSRNPTYDYNIAWETEVWIADAPDHLIHFDGEKFLGSYSAK